MLEANDDGQIKRIRLQIDKEQLAESEANLAWLRREIDTLRSKITKYLCYVCFFMACLVLLFFALPCLIPSTTSTLGRLVITRVAEIGLIVSLFMALKFSYMGIIFAIGFLALIMSYILDELIDGIYWL